MSKISLVNLANLQNENTAVSAINTNNATISNAVDNSLSRDGSQPNSMNANLDMNSFQILNLPSPATMNSPARLVDVVTNPTVSVALPVSGNNTWTGTNTFSSISTFNGASTFTGNALFKSGKPWFDVLAFGAVGNGINDDTSSIQAALTAAGAAPAGGGTVFMPNGQYKVTGTLTVPNGVRLMGSGKATCIIQASQTDAVVIQTNTGTECYLEGFWIIGKGFSGDPGFGANFPVITFNSTNGACKDVRLWGGNSSLNIAGNDNLFENVDAGNVYGNQAVFTTGSNWFSRCKIDSGTTAQAITSSKPYPAWASTTHYNVGQAVIVGSYIIVCTVSGTTGSSLPTLKNFGVNIIDGTATWQLVNQTTFVGVQMATGALENRFIQCDFSAPYSSSMISQAAQNFVICTDCVFSNAIDIVSATHFSVSGSALGDVITVYTGNPGSVNISDNWYSAASTIAIQANVNNFIVARNFMQGGTVLVATGTSDHYVITNNVGVTVTDNGSGTHKSITGNVT